MDSLFSQLDENENQPTTHPQYRQIALSIYFGVLVIGLFDWFLGQPPQAALPIDPTLRLIIFCTTVAALIALEIRQQTPSAKAHNQAITHLISKVLLSAVAVAITNYFYSQFLFLIAILFAELTFRRWISMLTIGTTFIILFLRLVSDSQGDLISNRDLLGLLIFIVAILFIMLLAQLSKREWSNRLRLQALHEELKASHKQLQENSEQLAELAVVNERNRLARDIHDSLGHYLTAVSIQLEMAIKLHNKNPAESLGAIKEAKTATQEALQDVRQSVTALRQPTESFDLIPAVELLISRITSDKLAITYRLDGDESQCPQPVRLAIYRAIQEGLTNIYKHAGASHVNLWLQFSPHQTRLRIIDDGIGFTPNQTANGTGLQGVQERIEDLDGKITIDSRPNDGTIIDITVPQKGI